MQNETFITKTASIIRRFGLYKTLGNIFRRLTARIFYSYTDIVFVIPEFKGSDFTHPDIKVLDYNRLKQTEQKDELTPVHIENCRKLLDLGCSCLIAEVEGQLAGYAAVQFNGIYTFSQDGKACMNIPNGYAVARNLFVLNKYRGLRIGQMLNAARLAIIKPGQIPVGFIIPENKYAMRNWEALGFQRQFIVRQRRIINSKLRLTFKDILDSEHTRVLKNAIISAST